MSNTMKRLALPLAGLLIAIALLEGLSYLALRIGAATTDPAASENHLFDAHRDHRPNPDFRFEAGAKGRLHSPDGFRSDSPVALEKAPGTIRIIALGTSALYGLGAAPPYPVHRPLHNDETITAHIERALNEKLAGAGLPARVEVINAGVSAYTTFHHVVHMLSRLVYYRPDLVINIDGHNDFYGNKPVDRWNSYPYSASVLVDEVNGRGLFVSVFTFVRALAPHSYFFALTEKVAKRHWQNTKVRGATLEHTQRVTLPVPADQKAAIGEYARQSWLRDLTVIRDLGRIEGFAHMVFAQPEVVLEEDARLTETDRWLKEITLQSMSSPEQMELMRAVAPMLPKLFAEREIDFHDLTRIAGLSTSGKALYVDYCHLSPEGARVLGETIAGIMTPKVLELARNSGLKS